MTEYLLIYIAGAILAAFACRWAYKTQRWDADDEGDGVVAIILLWPFALLLFFGIALATWVRHGKVEL